MPRDKAVSLLLLLLAVCGAMSLWFVSAAILPGMKSPTVLPLAMSGWSSVHTVIQEDKFWEIIHELKAKGAQGILVVPIQKMII